MRIQAFTLSLLLLLAGCAGSTNSPDGMATFNSEIDVQWSVDVDQRQPADPLAFSQPAVAGSWIVVGGRDAWAHIYDLSGHEVNRVALKGASDSSATAVNEHLVVLGDVTGMLYGIDPQQAKIVWQYQLTSLALSAPVLVDGDILLQTLDNHVYRFSADGEKKWSYASQAGTLTLYLSPAPLVHDQQVFVVFNNGDAVALKADNGDLIWRRQLLLDADASVLSDLKAAVASPVYLPQASFDLDRGHDVLLIPFLNADMMVVSRQDGSQLFARNLSLKTAPALSGGELVIADSEGRLQSVDMGNGQVLWSQKISEYALAGPVKAHGYWWVADEQGAVFRVSKDGLQKARVTLPSGVDKQPVAMADGVLVRTRLGAMYFLK